MPAPKMHVPSERTAVYNESSMNTSANSAQSRYPNPVPRGDFSGGNSLYKQRNSFFD